MQKQDKTIKEFDSKYKKLKNNHINLIEEYYLTKTELARTISYNDSLFNYLGNNMALLYKTSDSSDVYFVDLKYYTVDVFKKGSIFLNSLNKKDRNRLNVHLVSYPEWKFINIYNEFNGEYRDFVGVLKLYNYLDEYTPSY